MLKASYEVEVIVNGKPLKEYAHQGKVYIEGRKETTFSIRLRNNSYSRKLFVPTIDGLSVMDGKDASYDSSGYIVPGNSSITIDGWRVSDNKVAEFYFSGPEKSYRKRMKQGDNLGVIGCAVFEEKSAPLPTVIIQKEYLYPPAFACTCPFACQRHGTAWITTTLSNGIAGSVTLGSGCSALNAAYTCSNSAGSSRSADIMDSHQALGTGFGDYKKSDVVSVDFENKSEPTALFEIYYNTREQLEKMGINFHKEPHYVAPRAFPGQYCEPPQN